MAVFNPVVGPASDLLFLCVTELFHGGAVGAQAIGGDGLGRAMALERVYMNRSAASLSRVLVM